jgi:hypothetical protein
MRWLQRRTQKAPTRRSDPARIAELEYELFGIQPAPGTTAAAVVGMRHLAATLRGDVLPTIGGTPPRAPRPAISRRHPIGSRSAR